MGEVTGTHGKAGLEQIDALIQRGRHHEALAALDALAEPPPATPTAAAAGAEARLLRARALLSLERWHDAGEEAEAALEAYAVLEEAAGARLARLVQAQARMFAGQPHPARLFAREVLSAAEAANDALAMALGNYVLGIAQRHFNELRSSQEHLEMALAQWEALGHEWAEHGARFALGTTLARLGQLDEADACFSTVQAHSTAHDSTDMLARVINQRALLAWLRLDFDSARELLQQKLVLEEGLGLPQASLSTVHNLASVELQAGQHGAAERHLLRMLPVLQDTSQHQLLSVIYMQLALAALHLGRPSEALERARLAQRTLYDAPEAQAASVAATLGVVLLVNGRQAEAEEQWAKCPVAPGMEEQMTLRLLDGALRAVEDNRLSGLDLDGAMRMTASLWRGAMAPHGQG